MANIKLINDDFWNSDLSEIEAEFLDKGEKITDYPTYLNNVVPYQGSVLLDSVYYSED
ncbi:hypothetical protein SAMN05216302_103532 [Nitrosomonas aestuarii]|uniref:Uncharacterized protein n=1 Tax=Nitrosomonas aestuarii TaxID=52441 RepID=A0A1I4FB77_9PROT|nr:hypothetical protein [Nitrosomonas aestuarii]SFL15134.1 hypothetical protein SAMN05216302_103532 [Nitrosomonas aestuarii]